MDKLCIRCNGQIVDFDYLQTKFMNPPKYCERCRRDIRGYRVSVPDIQREQLAQWDNVVGFNRNFFVFEREIPDKKIDIYSLGGRNFCRPWSGVRYDYKLLWYVPQGLKDDDVFSIRKMEKQVKDRAHVYFVVETDGNSTNKTSDDVDKPLYLHKVCSWYKYTLKGLGRQFNRKSIIESPHDVIADVSNSARSGRFGHNCLLVVSPHKELDVRIDIDEK